MKIVNQHVAIDPLISVWVSASAGTGKTKVLIDRVLSLLLSGVEPNKILCLAFTKAAANEMVNRIHDILLEWSIIESDELSNRIKGLTGSATNKKVLFKARRLFFDVIDKGIKIETIHAFCQSLLKTFPLEASISPSFVVIDEQKSDELLYKAKELVFSEMARDKSLKESLDYLNNQFTQHKILDFLRIFQKSFKEFLWKKNHSNYINYKNVISKKSLDHDLCIKKMYSKDDFKNLNYAIRILRKGTSKDINYARELESWLKDENKSNEILSKYLSNFITKNGKIRKKLVSNSILKKFPEIEDILKEELSRVSFFKERLNNNFIKFVSLSISKIVIHILCKYKELKESLSFLDYDDLILKSFELMCKTVGASWVFYKLDSRIDHILIDEAQDVNDEQWEIISTLVSEFFYNNEKYNKTLFVVGDEKQSIYSFQGANPDIFDKKLNYFSNIIRNSHKEFKQVNLDVSFRSTKPILSLVDKIFLDNDTRKGVTIGNKKLKHLLYRKYDEGKVELWPLISKDLIEKDSMYVPPVDFKSIKDQPNKRLANIIAEKIKKWILGGKILASKKRKIVPKDILILVRRRTPFVQCLVTALKENNIPVSGVDRMLLQDSLAVMDLIALIKFLLFPKDDLSLGIVLKSPLIDLSEQQLFILCFDRRRVSLWERLKLFSNENNNINYSAFKEAYKYLNSLLVNIKYIKPYDFLIDILILRDGKKNFISNLGIDVEDPLNELIAMAISFEQTNIPLMQNFLIWLEDNDVEIKRDLAKSSCNEVRIMTVHGAKGLQAPIVFLPDTVDEPSYCKEIFCDDSEDFPVWIPAKVKNMDTDFVKSIRIKLHKKIYEEYKRLLYVAITRAEDQLYIAGWNMKKSVSETCWYSIIKNAMEEIGKPFTFNKGVGLELNYNGNNNHKINIIKEKNNKIEKPIDIDFFNEKINGKNVDVYYDKKVDNVNIESKSPLFNEKREKFKVGNIIHVLLDKLSVVMKNQREEVFWKIINRKEYSLTILEKKNIHSSVFKLLDSAKFSKLFSSNTISEVPVISLLKGKTVLGKIDLLVIEKDVIKIIDYKTDYNPPENVTNIPERYLLQMFKYQEIIKKMYSNKKIECYLIWTKTLNIMMIPDSLLLK